MKKPVVFAVLFLISMLSWGQDVDITQADFSKAVLSVAGPNLIYVRGMFIDGERISALLQADDSLGERWKLREVFSGSDDLSPESFSLEFAGIHALSNSEVEISNIFLDGKPFSTAFTLSPPDTAVVSRPLAPSKLDNDFNEKLSRVFGTLADEEVRYYEDRITELEQAATSFRMSLSDLKERNSSLETVIVKANEEISDKDTRIQDLEKDVERLKAADGSLGADNGALARSLEETKTQLREAQTEKGALEKQVRDLKAEQSVLNSKTADLEKRKGELEKAVAAYEKAAAEKTAASAAVSSSSGAAPAGTGSVPPARPPSTAVFSKADFKTPVLNGFVQTIPQLGSWTVTKNGADQTDGNQFFAKLIVPVVQKKERTLYSFEARSVGKGWVGFGLHIFANAPDNRKGYGFGNSLLIWLTRDPNYYGSPETHLQVYRSSDAVQMEQVLDCIIEEPVTEYLPLDVFYDPLDEYVSVLVNGVHKLTYKTWFDIEYGVEIALRTLGPGCQFRNLTVTREK